VNGNRVVDTDGEAVRGRIRAMWNGFAVVTIAVGAKGLNAEPEISTSGLFDEDDDPALDGVRLAVREALAKLSPKALKDDELVVETARIAARRAFRLAVDKRPVTRVHLVRLD
jgi:ribonuclease J